MDLWEFKLWKLVTLAVLAFFAGLFGWINFNKEDDSDQS